MDDVTLIHGDCLIEMPKLLTASFDMICADLPYGTTACSWDMIIPFEPLWAEYKRLIKPGGCVLLFGVQPFFSLVVASNLAWFRDELIWEKSRPVGFLDANRKPLNSHENIGIFSPGHYTYHPQKWQISERFMDRRKTFTILRDDSQVYGQREPKSKRKDDGWRYPLSIIPIESEWHPGMHTTQKPVALLEYLILTYTNDGDAVLDNTMGSGTAMVACIKTGRRGTGIELRRDYFKTAEERCWKARLQPPLFPNNGLQPTPNGGGG